MTRRAFRWPLGVVRRAVGHPHLDAHLAEQDAKTAELLLALDTSVLALDRRLLDLYALVDTTRAEVELRLQKLDIRADVEHAHARRHADSTEQALMSPEGPLAEHVSTEAARMDSYLVHHMTLLREDIGRGARVVAPVPPELDVVVPYGSYELAVPGVEQELLEHVLGGGREGESPGVRAALGRVLGPGLSTVDAAASLGFHSLAIADRVGQDGSLICFESAPHLNASLRRTLALNGFASRAEVRTIALTQAEGPILDDQIPPGTRIDLIRLVLGDAGAMAWRGTERIRRENPGIAFLVAPASPLKHGCDLPATVIEEIRSAGFALSAIASDDPGGALSQLEGESLPPGCDYVLIRRT